AQANPPTLAVARMSVPKGSPDGSFDPSRQTYTLSNGSDRLLPWAASKNRDWLSLTATEGVLGPSATTNVTVSANSLAGQLPPGSYTGTINFINNGTGQGNTSRNVTLKVRKPGTISRVSYEVGDGLLLGFDQFSFRISGTPGDAYVVESSRNLIEWTAVLTNTVPSAAYFDFIDAQPARFARRFY